jgi:hypothetical protein
LALWMFLPLNAIDLVLEVLIFIPYSFAMSFKCLVALWRLSSLFESITWSSAYSNVVILRFCWSWMPYDSAFNNHFCIIWFKYRYCPLSGLRAQSRVSPVMGVPSLSLWTGWFWWHFLHYGCNSYTALIYIS